eukprot:TRINITY_DN2854_c0_g1_i1.p2 TRINITY_DN2854_c0_g1~~TRINITY_DN2854_c0_g1_i1.p2  ORF type:complete len:139 (-),score=3.98 TRINITY_DN2854_c0_g1_i1:497-913(-)
MGCCASRSLASPVRPLPTSATPSMDIPSVLAGEQMRGPGDSELCQEAHPGVPAEWKSQDCVTFPTSAQEAGMCVACLNRMLDATLANQAVVLPPCLLCKEVCITGHQLNPPEFSTYSGSGLGVPTMSVATLCDPVPLH